MSTKVSAYHTKVKQLVVLREAWIRQRKFWQALLKSHDCIYVSREVERANREICRFMRMLDDLAIKRVTLKRKVDTLKSNWCVWECDAILNNDVVVPGFVQGDFSGNCVDFSSFEGEES
jgi:hypothetical protein